LPSIRSVNELISETPGLKTKLMGECMFMVIDESNLSARPTMREDAKAPKKIHVSIKAMSAASCLTKRPRKVSINTRAVQPSAPASLQRKHQLMLQS
jgi:hypothetical protein